jgi:multiple sugar transport system ATP-binding protein
VQGKMFDPRDLSPGEVLTFRLSLDRAHIFDAATGRTVRDV